MEQQDCKMRTYSYRWLILLLYGLQTGISMFQNNEFSIIEDKVKLYFNTSSTLIRYSALVFVATQLICLVPAIIVVEKFSLRLTLILASFLTLLGTSIKIVAPISQQFYIIIIGQTLCGIAQSLLVALPSKLVGVWCSAKEQNRVCSLALWGGLIGTGLGSTIPLAMIEDETNKDTIRERLLELLSGNALISGVMFLAVIILFRNKPPLPPSIQQEGRDVTKMSFKKSVSSLVGNKEFIKLLLVFGVATGIYTTYGILQNKIYQHYFPNNMEDLEVIPLLVIVFGGMIGSPIAGVILDKTLKYKVLTCGIVSGVFLSYAALASCLELSIHIGTYISLLSMGLIFTLSINIGFQYVAEVTYPVSEMVTLSSLYLVSNILSLIFENVLGYFADAGYWILLHSIILALFLSTLICSLLLSPNLNRMLQNKASG